MQALAERGVFVVALDAAFRERGRWDVNDELGKAALDTCALQNLAFFGGPKFLLDIGERANGFIWAEVFASGEQPKKAGIIRECHWERDERSFDLFLLHTGRYPLTSVLKI